MARPEGLPRLCLMLVALMPLAHAFYLPGVAPKTFQDGETVTVKVQTLVSTETPLQFDYYQLPFCKPPKVHDLPENLGEALAGDKAHTSAYEGRMKVNEFCKVLCRKTYTKKQMEEFQDFTVLNYRVNMRLDGLPVAEVETLAYEDNPAETIEEYDLGYSLGAKLPPPEKSTGKEPQKWVLNNHLRFKILYHTFSSDDKQAEENEKAGNYIVGFQVQPYTVRHEHTGEFKDSDILNVSLKACSEKGMNANEMLVIDPDQETEVVWSYDVLWERSPVKWASRWDMYLQMRDDDIHWFSIVNSFLILVFLTGIVGMIMARVLLKDFAKYNEVLMDVEVAGQGKEDSGWKLVNGDVFRPPPHPTLLSVYAGSGMQLLIMCILTLLFAALGFLSPANRGSLLTASVFFFVLMGVPAGYVSARFCKLVQEPNHFKCTLLTSVLFPGVCFLVFFIINTIAWAKQSSTAVPFGTLVVLCLLWFGVSLPLIFVGSHLGFKKDTMALPCKVNSQPREIPPQQWWLGMGVSILFGGMLPFGALFVEMFFILSSMWQHRFYYMFGFLFLVFAILIVTCAESTVVMCYLHLCAEDYRWWWRSFFTSGATAFYFFAYGAYHYFARAHPSATYDITSTCIYFGYMFIMAYATFVLTGFIGFVSCFAFIKKIYGSIKID